MIFIKLGAIRFAIAPYLRRMLLNMLQLKNALSIGVNFLSHPYLDIKNSELMSLAKQQPQSGIYVLTFTEQVSGDEVALMVGKATRLCDHLNFVLSKFRSTAKADYKNRFVAEQIALKYGIAIPLNIFWFPADEGGLQEMELEFNNKYKPIFGMSSKRTKCTVTEYANVIFSDL